MKKIDRYQWLFRNTNADIAWIAGVFLDGANAALRLKGLMKAVQEGREVSSRSFVMPYESVCVDGATMGPWYFELLGK